MFGGPEMYDLAKQLTEERVRQADHKRMISHVARLRAAASKTQASATPPSGGQLTLEWTTSGLAGGRVTVSNPYTGRSRTGRHPFDWDQAFTRAIHGSS